MGLNPVKADSGFHFRGNRAIVVFECDVSRPFKCLVSESCLYGGMRRSMLNKPSTPLPTLEVESLQTNIVCII